MDLLSDLFYAVRVRHTVTRIKSRPYQQILVTKAEAKRNIRRSKRLSAIGGIERA